MSGGKFLFDQDDSGGGSKPKPTPSPEDVKNAEAKAEQEKNSALYMAEQAKSLRLQKELRQDTIEQLKIELDVQQTMGDVRDASITRQKLVVEMLEQQVSIEKEIKNLEETKQELKVQGGEFSEKEQKLLKEKQKQIKEIKEELTGIIGNYENANAELSKHEKKLKKVENAANRYDDVIGGFATKIGLGNSALKNSVGRLLLIGKEIEKNAEKQEEFAKAVKQTFSAANIAGSLLQSFVEFAAVIDKSQTALAAATGAGDRFASNITTIKTEGMGMGRSFENIQNSLKQFNSSLLDVNSISNDTINQMGGLATDLQRVGVTADQFTKSINTITRTMGVSNKQAAKLTKELALMGTKMGISSSKMMTDFTAASAVLGAQGGKSIAIFKNLAAAARNTGVEMNELLSIAGKFDTFTSAAETTGQLNAILGSQLSATKMLMMNEDERIETIIRTVKAQGIAFNQMDKFTQRAIANAAGITDMSKANQIFGMSLGAYRKSQAEMKRQADVQKKFEEAIKATIPIQEAFAEAIQAITSNEDFLNFLEDAIEFVKGFALGFAELNKDLDGIPGLILLTSAALAAFMPILGGFASLLKIVSFGMISLGGSTTKTALISNKAVKIFAKALKKLALTGKLTSGGIMKLGVSLLLVAGAIYIAFLGAAELVKAFSGLGDAGFAAALGLLAFGVAIAGIAYALTALGGASIAVGPGIAVLALLGGTMLIIGLAAKMIVDSFDKMTSSMTSAMSALTTNLTNVTFIADMIQSAADKLDGMSSNKKIELMSTLNSMATIATGGRYIAQQSAGTSGGAPAPAPAPAPAVNNQINMGNLKLVIKNGVEFDAYIQTLATQ